MYDYHDTETRAERLAKGRDHCSNAIKHETLFHNAPVEAAGELQIVNGVVVGINDHSGTYRTAGLMRVDRRMARAVLTSLQAAKVPMADAVLDFLRTQAGP